MNRTDTRLPFGMPRDVGILAVTNLIWGLGEGLFIFFYPLSLQRWQIDSVQIGAVLSLLGVIMAVVQAPAGYLSDRFGTRPVDPRCLDPGGDRGRHDGSGKELTIFCCGFDRLQHYLLYCRAAQQLYHPDARQLERPAGHLLCLRFLAGRRNCWPHVGWLDCDKQPGWRWFSGIPPGSFSSRP